MGSKRDELGICFGGCTSNRQCYDIWGGNHKCLAPVRLPTNEVSTKVASTKSLNFDLILKKDYSKSKI
jgi:hypothetical protein